MTPKERKRIKEAKKWMESPEGKREIKKALQEAKELSDQFKEASKVTRDMLNNPVTM